MSPAELRPGRPRRGLVGAGILTVLVLLLALVIVRTAWVADDAFITFRTIDNLLNGYGLRWNPAERVQTFTHPLWLLLLTPFVAISGNPYLSSLALSALFTAVTVAVLLRASWTTDAGGLPGGGPGGAAAALLALTLSKSFVEYSTSGLENPLSHALLAALMLAALEPARDRRRAFWLGTLLAAVALTRLDLVLLAGPIAVGALRRPRETMPWFVAGLWPLAAWEVFSVVYYGVPLPNTAYAKLATGIPRAELAAQGLTYLIDALNRDPLLIFTLLAGVATGAAVRPRLHGAAAAGIVISIGYVVSVGGDFMAGRFLTPAFVVALFVLLRTVGAGSSVAAPAAVAMVAVLGLSAPTPIVFSGPGYSSPRAETIFSPTGITDERGFYFQRTGMLTEEGFHAGVRVDRLMPWISDMKERHPRAFVHYTIGMIGYYTGPDRHIIDRFALGDPLLARLPATRPWRIGHYARALPDGYVESVENATNVVGDPDVRALYELIRVVTRGPIWSWRRWRAVWTLNTMELPLE